MSSIIPPKPRVLGGAKAHISIVAAKFNPEFTDALVENVVDELGSLVENPKVDIIRVPGAFEIPVVTKAVLEEDKPQCIIALGCIIRGATAHADLVAGSVTDQLATLALEYSKPIIHEVLLVEDEKQAYARCIGQNLNRGREAARSAIETIAVMSEITKSQHASIRLHPSNV